MIILAEQEEYEVTLQDIQNSKTLSDHFELDNVFCVNYSKKEIEFYLEHSRTKNLHFLKPHSLIELINMADFFRNIDLLIICTDRLNKLLRTDFDTSTLSAPLF